ncbi:MAG: hypothetical protein Q4E43_04835 [Akkermansia sp.]|nr:hypothetical protein [Akkermansia sp.]
MKQIAQMLLVALSAYASLQAQAYAEQDEPDDYMPGWAQLQNLDLPQLIRVTKDERSEMGMRDKYSFWKHRSRVKDAVQKLQDCLNEKKILTVQLHKSNQDQIRWAQKIKDGQVAIRNYNEAVDKVKEIEINGVPFWQNKEKMLANWKKRRDFFKPRMTEAKEQMASWAVALSRVESEMKRDQIKLAEAELSSSKLREAAEKAIREHNAFVITICQKTPE